MNKPNYLFNHLLKHAFQDESTGLIGIRNPNRLSLYHRETPGDWNTVAHYISGYRRWPATWFPDTNVAILPGTDAIWNALRISALGSSDGSTVITGVVERELKEWLDDPWREKERANDIRAAMDAGTWIRRFRFGQLGPIDLAIMGYTHLLGVRRLITQQLSDGATLVGTDPADKSQTMNTIKQRLGERALGLAKKGRKDIEELGVINISDEMHCLMVIVYAIINHKNSLLLTADEDHLEIFYKAQWFFDTHYRAWLAARMIKEGRYGEPVTEFTDTNGYFDGPLTLYRRPTNQLQETLPLAFQPVQAGVVCVTRKNTIRTVIFQFETQMQEMLVTRGATNGRCTDLFGDANVHVDLGSLKPKLDGLYLGIGKDAVVEFETNGIRCLVSRLDLEHAVHCFERHTPVDNSL